MFSCNATALSWLRKNKIRQARSSPEAISALHLLAQLLGLNQAVAQRIEKGEPVTAPGIPANFPTPETLISDDCIRPPSMP
jgi:hypothetical protein